MNEAVLSVLKAIGDGADVEIIPDAVIDLGGGRRFERNVPVAVPGEVLALLLRPRVIGGMAYHFRITDEAVAARIDAELTRATGATSG
jgi:hypothetical protein